ncbi:MAG: hypothetical protein ACKPAH_03645, partial [Verrucomicrobiota bacterium]
AWAGPPLAFNFEQLLGKADLGEAGRLAGLGVIEVHDDLRATARLSRPADETADLEPRARSWLHGNCAHCHRWGAGGAVPLFLNFDRPLADSRLIDVAPARGTFGMAEARVIAPGDPWRSVLWYRICTEGSGRMPIQGSRRVDEAGTALVARWIAGLATAPSPTESVRAARARVSAASPSELPIDQTSGALAYLARVASADPAVVRRAIESTNGPTRDLFQRFLPASRRRRVLGEGWDEAAMQGLAGDAGRGGALFHADSGPQCGRCHRAEGKGREFGPGLDGIASRLDRNALLEQIRWPSRRIAPEFALHQVETRDGLQHSGFVVPAGKLAAGAAAPEGLRLRTEGGEVTTLARDAVVSDTISPVSAMPEGLLDAMTPQEVADLLAYLARLRAVP